MPTRFRHTFVDVQMAGFTHVSWSTSTPEVVDEVSADTIVLTRSCPTLINVVLADYSVIPCGACAVERSNPINAYAVVQARIRFAFVYRYLTLHASVPDRAIAGVRTDQV